MKAMIEGLLFVKGSDGLSLEELVTLTNGEANEVKKALKELYDDYQSEERGIQLELLGNRYKLTTKEEHRHLYEQLTFEEETSTLSNSALEVLAIIAYNEPITRLDIDEIRGVNSSYVIRKLLLKNLIEEVGRADMAGRPKLYGVTNDFLDYFGLNSTSELPELNPVEEVDNDEKDLFASKYSEEEKEESIS